MPKGRKNETFFNFGLTGLEHGHGNGGAQNKDNLRLFQKLIELASDDVR